MLTILSGTAASCTLDVIDRDWTESEATWDIAKGSTEWSDSEDLKVLAQNQIDWIKKGGEINPSRAVAFDGVAGPGIEVIEITDIISDMIKGNIDNNGFLLRTFYGNSSDRSYVSDDYKEAPEARPLLIVKYDTSSPVTSASKIMKQGFVINQSGGKLHLSVEKSGLYSVSVLSMNGQLISAAEISKQKKFTVNTSLLGKGVYFVKLKGDGVDFTDRIILK